MTLKRPTARRHLRLPASCVCVIVRRSCCHRSTLAPHGVECRVRHVPGRQKKREKKNELQCQHLACSFHAGFGCGWSDLRARRTARLALGPGLNMKHGRRMLGVWVTIIPCDEARPLGLGGRPRSSIRGRPSTQLYYAHSVAPLIIITHSLVSVIEHHHHLLSPPTLLATTTRLQRPVTQRPDARKEQRAKKKTEIDALV